MKKLLFATAIGALLAWLFDPELGPQRRDDVRRRLDNAGLTNTASSPATL